MEERGMENRTGKIRHFMEKPVPALLLAAGLAVLLSVGIAAGKPDRPEEKECTITEEKDLIVRTAGVGAFGETGRLNAAGLPAIPHPVNPLIDAASQDRTRLEWGQGRNFDVLNRPGGAVAYQQKYGPLSSYFLGPWKAGDPKAIYLTSDLGFVNQATTDFLNALKAKNVPCVFFVTLNVLENNPDIIQRIISEGHQLANHSATHPAKGLPSLSLEQQIREITLPHEKALRDYGYEMRLFRFPAGIFSAQSLAVVNNCNYRSVFWSYAYQDWDTKNQPNAAVSLQKAVERLHPGAIYLLHGISSTNAAILPGLVDAARAQGYVFKAL